MKTQWMRTGYQRTFAGIDAQADARTFVSDRRRTMPKGLKLRIVRVGSLAFSVEEWRMENVG